MPDPEIENVLTIVSVVDHEALGVGQIVGVERTEDAGAYVPPTADKGSNLAAAFLGLLVNDPAIRSELLKASELYPYFVVNPGDLIYSHLLSWEVWEPHPDKWQPGLADTIIPFGSLFGLPDDACRLYALPPEYREAILHLCARLRMGPSWPRLVHAAAMTYLMTKADPNGWPEGASFEPVIWPRPFSPQVGTWVGYHPIPRVRLSTPHGEVVLMSPDQDKREVLRATKPTRLRRFVEDNWGKLEAELEGALGYSRRRKPSTESESHVQWLFRRHIQRLSDGEIAGEFHVEPSTVETVVKDRRRELDLQLNSAVRCLDHKQRPKPFY